jgi:hypothetical protein
VTAVISVVIEHACPFQPYFDRVLFSLGDFRPPWSEDVGDKKPGFQPLGPPKVKEEEGDSDQEALVVDENPKAQKNNATAFKTGLRMKLNSEETIFLFLVHSIYIGRNLALASDRLMKDVG